MNSIVLAKVNVKVQQEAAIVLAKIGLTISDVCSMLLNRIVQEKALPFELLTPNEQTKEAIKTAREGKFSVICDLDTLIGKLNAHN